jgi:hypothetical protein
MSKALASSPALQEKSRGRERNTIVALLKRKLE